MFAKNKSAQKFNTSMKVNEAGQRNAKINRREMTSHRQNAKINHGAKISSPSFASRCSRFYSVRFIRPIREFP